MAKPFDEIPAAFDVLAMERDVLELWKRERVFGRTLEKDAPKGPWVFYEGPPTANGMPGVHHVSSRAFKDLFPRYKTMQGYRVGRKGGWDTHGLPVEIAVEKQLGITNKAQIEEYGIERFNALCREIVFANIREWNEMTERIAFWVDLDDAYVTYHDAYVESCWWVMKALFDRGLLEEDLRTTWHSPSSNTTLASHEVSLGYREDVEDPSVFPAFPAVPGDLRERGLLPEGDDLPVSYLAWTTTPWTLPANAGLAVHPEADYALVAGPARRGGEGEERLNVVALELVESVYGDTPHRVVGTLPGRALAGARYRPIMRGVLPAGSDAATGWRVVADAFVTLEDGTGVVHVAPAYGDLEVGRRHALPTVWSVDLTGSVMPGVRPHDDAWASGTREQTAPAADAPADRADDATRGPYAGSWFKDADAAITRDLDERGLMFAHGTITHTYPFNWRDWTPLMNVAKKSWYIRTSRFRDQLLATNDAIAWYPDHVRTGRFGRWLENNVDWALSRERYWGAPLPIWRGEDGSLVCVGSVAELSELVGRDLADLDLHRPAIDQVEFVKDGVRYRREPYTVDVWFESGAMPYAQWHYLGQETGEAAERLAENFPADYICEAIDQTRGWFYSLHALATLLTHDGSAGLPRGPLADLAANSPAFRNVIVLGHIVDEQGEKMSKSKGNVVNPFDVLNAQGADALRWYLYASSPPEANKRFSLALVEEALRDFFMTLWNTVGFFTLYANLDRPDLDAAPGPSQRPLVDRWLTARLHVLVRDVTAALDGFDATTACRAIRAFVVDDLSNWYVRRNRRRFWRGGGGGDARSAYRTLYDALVTVSKLIAPMAPFSAEAIHQNLVRRVDEHAPVSVHLERWPEHDPQAIDEELLSDMAALVRTVELGRAARAQSAIKVRQPLAEVLVRLPSQRDRAGVERLQDQLLEELNVKSVRFLGSDDAFVDYTVRPNLPVLGRRFGSALPKVRAALAAADPNAVAARVNAGEGVELEVDGETVRLDPDEVLLDARSPEGYAAVEDRGALVALETTLTPELVREGLVRDAVRLVQDARKQAGLEVADRIELSVLADDPEAAAALREHAGILTAETLTEELRQGPLAEAAFETSGSLGAGAVRIALRRSRGA